MLKIVFLELSSFVIGPNRSGWRERGALSTYRADHRPADGADDQVPEPGQGLGPYNSPYSDISGKLKFSLETLSKTEV